MSDGTQKSQVLLTLLIADEIELFALRKALDVTISMMSKIEVWQASVGKSISSAERDELQYKQLPALRALQARIGSNP